MEGQFAICHEKMGVNICPLHACMLFIVLLTIHHNGFAKGRNSLVFSIPGQKMTVLIWNPELLCDSFFQTWRFPVNETIIRTILGIDCETLSCEYMQGYGRIVVLYLHASIKTT